MKFVFYFFIIAQFLNFLGVFAEKVKEDSSEFNPIKWEKVREIEEKPLKKIIWKSYNEDKSYFEKTELKNRFTNGMVSPAPIEIKIKGDIALKIIDQS